MSEAENRGHAKLGEVLLGADGQFTVVTTFKTIKLRVSEETPLNERELRGLHDLLNGRKPK